MNRYLLFILGIITIFLALDLWTKKWATQNLNKNKNIFSGKIQLVYVRNYGIAFNKLSGRKNLIIIINLFLFIYLGYLLYTDISNYFPYSLILAGGLGNFIDRIHRGYVVDFIYFNIKGWPVFNLADFEIFIGVGVILVTELVII